MARINHFIRPRLIRLPALFVSFLGLAAIAAAAPPAGGAGPEEEACAGRASKDACTLPNNQLGTCAAATCNRLDYSGGSPPKAIEEACVVCKAAGGQPHDGMPMLGGDGGSEPPPADSGATEPASSDSGSKEPPESASRCRVDGGSGPAGLALLAGLLLIARGRRRRSSDRAARS